VSGKLDKSSFTLARYITSRAELKMSGGTCWQMSNMEKGLTIMGWAIWLHHTWTQLGPLVAAADICSTLADDSVVLGSLWDDRGVRTYGDERVPRFAARLQRDGR
jgi:hypothetical protein